METRHNCSNQSLPLLPLLSVSPRVVSPSPPSLSPPSLTSLVEQLMMHLLLLVVVIVQQQLKLKNFLNSWRFGPFFGGYAEPDNIHIPLNYICISFDGAFFAFEHLPRSTKKKKNIKIAPARSAEEQTAGRCDRAPLQAEAVTSGGHEG